MPNAETPFPVADASARRYGPRVVVVEVPTACPVCGSTRNFVRTSRRETETVRRRYRICSDCGGEFASLYQMQTGRTERPPTMPHM
jgi:DNA-directed RNA polymerase subunit M/transcription elongation factor TFIIS